MAEKLSEHPLLTYLIFGLPMALLAIEIVIGVDIFLLILIVAWLGVAFMVLFLPIESDNGSSS